MGPLIIEAPLALDVVFANITADSNFAREHGNRVNHARILQMVEFSDSMS